ncbi:DUF397 domain-containing protein [Streptomyces sp. SL13]|jgi:hypothetical protein|uniref:DUF397 domain-containing protein n=1 Tax=Streptantibioticus silvisoli TaxID=2705255 RepID=A0AA90H010_9ACTN|nr:DUF397 domain-containing protein [Streptantibioticus silvisoli]MDI5967342.1 DUF397 domain-containing protein [Streptantibioticus silvisoli]MDI5971448.1 DUF397 domain-containing protein [Streptantibioticus silvisoli]
MNDRQIQQGVTAEWKKSSYSGAHGDCVEVRSPGTAAVAVRDSKDPQGPALSFSPQAWSAFVTGIDAGAFGQR